MDPRVNNKLIEMTKEITAAKMTSTTVQTSGDGGKAVADFMQAIYDKLVEFQNNND